MPESHVTPPSSLSIQLIICFRTDDSMTRWSILHRQRPRWPWICCRIHLSVEKLASRSRAVTRVEEDWYCGTGGRYCDQRNHDEPGHLSSYSFQNGVWVAHGRMALSVTFTRSICGVDLRALSVLGPGVA